MPMRARGGWSERIADIPELPLMFPADANGVFLKMARACSDRSARRPVFYTFIGGGVRLMFAWDTPPERGGCAGGGPEGGEPRASRR